MTGVGVARRCVLAAACVLMLGAVPALAETIPVIVKDTTSQYWQVVLAGARQAGKDLGVSVPEMGAQSEADIAGQITALENAVASNPTAIVIAPTQFAALGAPITDAAQSVKIIGIDSGADTDAFTSFLTTDNEAGGKAAARALAAAVKARTGKAEGEVALITALPGVGSLDQRAKGFKEELAASYPGLKLVADKVADGQPTTGLNITTDLLTANPNLVGIFASNLPMAQGAGQAVAESKPKNLSLIGFDSDPKLVQFLKDGALAALVVQDPYRMGYEGIRTALAAAKGQSVPKNVDTGVTVITGATMDTPRAQELLNPKIN
ncbi:monosaccharide ABC transporter substrate-binding protein, CUT2 family [Arboricoccus pini]|uniref:Monosaccharide ABC transporter substrate-binding protein, CUT2 family n=1 Tax=Arboricoccus pini TaxID=1963835 RepID=A0A212RZE8_9PROT|nr:monosaccharide ABC transporter substrate-binding protein, CUT2 family [Arboricoccus pini]